MYRNRTPECDDLRGELWIVNAADKDPREVIYRCPVKGHVGDRIGADRRTALQKNGHARSRIEETLSGRHHLAEAKDLDGQTAGKKRIEPGFANPLRQVVSAVRSRPIAGDHTLRNPPLHPTARTATPDAADAKETIP